jgi:hypothetical protein
MSRGQSLHADTEGDARAPATSARAGIDTWPEDHEPAERGRAQGGPAQRRRIDADPESVERGLVSLVLTVVELLRQLMERQALRRVDQGTLSDDKVEEIGQTLMALESRMTELREHFGLEPEDLNLDLGPLGPLLPYE